MKWHDCEEIGLEGRGFADAAHPYNRLPARAEERVPEWVYRLGEQSVGLCVRFRSNASDIHARIVLRLPGEAQFHYRKYLDLYARDHNGQWRWAGTSKYGVVPSGETPILEGVPAKEREYLLYLPLFFSVERLAIGVNDEAVFEGLAPRTERAIVIYGTSIVHGSSASRPGMVFPSILGRRLDVPVINLGFSGAARCEPPLAEFIAELTPAAFVIDPLANMSAELIGENGEPFLRRLLAAHPSTPVLMVEDRVHTNAWLNGDADMDGRRRKWARWRDLFDRLTAEGFTRLRYQTGKELLGDDSDLTVDGSHPTDLGYRRMADICEPHWRALLD